MISADDIRQRYLGAEFVLPAGTQKMGKFEWNVALNASRIVLGAKSTIFR